MFSAQSRKVQSIILSSLLIIISIIVLYQDYQQAGKFRWVSQDRIEDYEELYLNVIAVNIIGLSLIFLISKIINRKISSIWLAVFEFVNCIYGLFIALISLIGLFSLIQNSPNVYIDFGWFTFILLLLVIFYLGILIIYQSIFTQNHIWRTGNK